VRIPKLDQLAKIGGRDNARIHEKSARPDRESAIRHSIVLWPPAGSVSVDLRKRHRLEIAIDPGEIPTGPRVEVRLDVEERCEFVRNFFEPEQVQNASGWFKL
jgi:hypothetical protein